MSSGVPPTNPNQPNQPPTEPSGNQPPSKSPFAKLMPGASAQEIQKFTNGFINFTIQQMKQDQQNMLEALKKMQEDQDGGS
jgi:hypothetical protein